jgi:Family of unknown function (DUF5771)
MMIRRKAYTYVRRDGKRVHVPATLIKNRGATGRGKQLIGPLRKGLLGKYGYGDVKHMSLKARKEALAKAVRALGRLHVEKSLIAASTYTKRTSPMSSRRFKANERWVARTY